MASLLLENNDDLPSYSTADQFDSASFSQLGVALIKKNNIPKSILDPFSDLLELESWRDSSLEVFKFYKSTATKKGGIGLGKENGFRELVSKDLHRFDVNLDHLRDNNYSPSPHELSLKSAAEFVKNRIHSILVNILGSQYIMNALGFVLAEPGSQAQNWHVDSSHLFQPSDNINCTLPSHFVTVFFPLVDITCLEIGPTEIALGSHHHTHVLKNEVVSDQYPGQETVAGLLAREGVRTVKVCCEAGDIVIMDGRVLHRGLGNASRCQRPLMYISYCRPWYHEFPRSQNEGRSLFS